MPRPKGIQLPVQSEGDLLRSIKQILRILAAEKILVWKRIHVMPILFTGPGGITGMRSNPEQCGMPDLMLWTRGVKNEEGGYHPGYMLCIELKSNKGRLSPAQEQFGNDLTDMGHIYRVVRSLQQFCALLREAGITHWVVADDGKKSQ